jgi:hypothetical protein
MRPELERALRLNPKIRKRLRDQLDALQRAVSSGTDEEIVAAAQTLVTFEAEAEADIGRKRSKPRRCPVRFRVSDADYANLAETALEYQLDPDEVARRLFDCGRRFVQHFWSHIRGGGTADTLFSTSRGSPSPLPAMILPDFSRREP